MEIPSQTAKVALQVIGLTKAVHQLIGMMKILVAWLARLSIGPPSRYPHVAHGRGLGTVNNVAPEGTVGRVSAAVGAAAYLELEG